MSETTELRSLALDMLHLSSTPAQTERRAHLDKAKLAELAASIKSHGLVQPILVRPYNGGNDYEVVAGERRVLAARQAGLEVISATVRELTDEQVYELQLIENLQRQDLHELAEAEGYEALLKLGHTVDDMAAKVGKSRGTVYARMKLLALGKDARKAFYGGKISASVALLLARIPIAEHQKQALEEITDEDNDEPMSYRRALEHIQRDYMTRLDQAGFPTSDPDLVPAAGSCLACPKRTGNQRELFGDIKHADVCTDLVCFKTKRAAHAKRRLQEAQAAGQEIIDGAEAKKIVKYSTHSLEGGYVRLDDRCYDDPKHRTYGQILGKEAKPALLAVPPLKGEERDGEQVIEVVRKADVSAAMKDRGVKVTRDGHGSYRESQRKEERKKKLERAFRRALFNAIHDRARPKVGRPELETLAISMFDRHQHETRKQIFDVLGWKVEEKPRYGYGNSLQEIVERKVPTMTDVELHRFIQDLSIAEELLVWSFSSDPPKKMLAAAKRLKINTDKLRKELAAAAVTKGKKPAKKK